MRNIPTDLLRAFVAVIDLGGFTRAADKLGRTQPAISLQMKRLQELLGVPLFEKDSWQRLNERGEMVAGYARQILALNDEMMLKLADRNGSGRLRLGLPNDYADHFLPRLMSAVARESDGLTFDVTCDLSHNLLRGLRSGHLDLVIAMTADGPAEGAFMTWKEPLEWVASTSAASPHAKDENGIRIVCYPEGCLYRRSMLTALQRDGRPFQIVYTSPSLSGLEAAVGAGFGLTVLARRIVPPALRVMEAAHGLPRPADVVVGLYVGRDRARMTAASAFAARFADLFSGNAESGHAA